MAWTISEEQVSHCISFGFGMDGDGVLVVDWVVKCSPRIGFDRRKGPRLDDAGAPELVARPSKGPAKAPGNQEF